MKRSEAIKQLLEVSRRFYGKTLALEFEEAVIKAVLSKCEEIMYLPMFRCDITGELNEIGEVLEDGYFCWEQESEEE